MLTRDQILRHPDLQPVAVKVPEWGGEVCVRGMTAEERDDLESRAPGGLLSKLPNVRAAVAELCVCDEGGKRLFEVGDLKGRSAAALDRIFWKAIRLSGLTKDELDDVAKN